MHQLIASQFLDDYLLLRPGHAGGVQIPRARFVSLGDIHNAHELDAMVALADRYGFPRDTFTNMSPTIGGAGDVLATQAPEYLRPRKPFTGCNAGHTFFHADPFGHASICKIGRDPHVALMREGIKGLHRLGDIADGLQLRTGGCSGCMFGQNGTCTTCRPLAKLYQEAKAPLNMYCQHAER